MCAIFANYELHVFQLTPVNCKLFRVYIAELDEKSKSFTIQISKNFSYKYNQQHLLRQSFKNNL
jgi:hypothetical protein